MSNQALTWAFDQDGLPCKAKFVLVSIANHADHTNGYCWLKVSTIAQEASIPERSLYRYLGALVRNGYLRRQKNKGADGKQRANDYWIIFDRPEAPWSWGAGIGDDDPTEAQDDVEPTAKLAVGETDANDAAADEKTPEMAVGPTAIGGGAESSDEPPKTKPENGARVRPFAAPPRSYKPPPVVHPIQGATQVGEHSKPFFVIVGTRAWNAWLDYKKTMTGIRGSPTRRKFVENVGWRDGWDFPSLFPPGERAQSESSEEGSGSDPPIKKTA